MKERRGKRRKCFVFFSKGCKWAEKGENETEQKKSEFTESQEGSEMEGCMVSPLSVHVVYSSLLGRCGLGLWALGIDSVFLPLMGRGSLH